MAEQSPNATVEDRLEKLIIALGQRAKLEIEVLQSMAGSLTLIEQHLAALVLSANPAPNYQKPLAEYLAFDWSSIGATIIESDGDGPTAVEWHGRMFTRRAPSNRFDAAVWFSRAAGKDPTTGNTRYERLITFKDASEAGEIPGKTRQQVAGARGGRG